MAIAYGAHVGAIDTGSVSAAGLTVTLSSPIPSGHTVVIRAVCEPAKGPGTFIVSDSKGNTYVQDEYRMMDGDYPQTAILSGQIVTALVVGDTITITFPSIARGGINIDEFAGSLTKESSTSVASAVHSAGLSTQGTATSGKLVVGATYYWAPPSGFSSTADTDTTGGAWNSLDQSAGNSGVSRIEGAYKIPNVSGTQTYNPTNSPIAYQSQLMVVYAEPGVQKVATARFRGKFLTSVVVDEDPDNNAFNSYNYSGVLINQNAESVDPEFGSVALAGEFVVQEFYLPSDFGRGTINQIYPYLTGIQVCVGVDEGLASSASVDYYLQQYVFGHGWQPLVRGTQVGTHADGERVWMSIYFDPVEIQEAEVTNKFRIGIRGRTSTGLISQLVEYDGTHVVIDNQEIPIMPDISPVPLEEGRTYPFTFKSTPSFLYVEPGSEAVYFSVQRGVNKVWYSTPNPLALQRTRGYFGDGVTPIYDRTRDVSLMFRLLGSVADEGVDYLGNLYRSALVNHSIDNLRTSDRAVRDRYWLSKPNPSKFAVESLYFDVRQQGQATVVDRIYLDPMTPGVFFNVYYSTDSHPGRDDATWERLLWNPVPKTYQMSKKDTFTLPEPITANFVKIEFTHLQARYYSPGNFQRPILYKKYPSWVLDYFLAIYQSKISTYDPFIARQVEVVYDALDLAFSYYSDDLKQNPDDPTPLPDRATDANRVTSLLQSTPDFSNSIDATTLSRIRIAFQPYLSQPRAMGRYTSVLGMYGLSNDTGDYSTEVLNSATADTTVVSNLDREGLILEKDYPVMYFYLPCRHGYRESLALFDNDVAYFAGVKEIAFLRDKYNTQKDERLYIESTGDNVNVRRNDLEVTDGSWTVY